MNHKAPGPEVGLQGSLSRRTLLKASALIGGATLAAPWIVKNAFASSGELNFMGWAGYDFQAAFDAFQSKTGIKVNFTPQPDQDAFAAQAKAGGAEGVYDICEPTADRVLNWIEQDFLQPLDTASINADGVEDDILNGAAGRLAVADGKMYASPSVWGTEGLAFNSDEVKLEYGEASWGDLWDSEYAGRVVARPHSGLVIIGLWMEREGKLPHPFRDSFENEQAMAANYDVITKRAVELKGNIGQWWKDENTAQGAYIANGCVIGHIWDTTAQGLQKQGMPISYLAPVEGALAWLQNFVMFKGAKNVAQANAWIAWVNSPEGSAAWANAYFSNPAAKGAAEALSETQKEFLGKSFPGDALSKMWWWPAQPSWFVAKRNEYADKWQSA